MSEITAKGQTNRRWTSTEEYRNAHDRIFNPHAVVQREILDKITDVANSTLQLPVEICGVNWDNRATLSLTVVSDTFTDLPPTSRIPILCRLFNDVRESHNIHVLARAWSWSEFNEHKQTEGNDK
jgi:hypothetical protein